MKRADRSAATIRKVSRIACSLASRCAHVNDFLPGRDIGEGQARSPSSRGAKSVGLGLVVRHPLEIRRGRLCVWSASCPRWSPAAMIVGVLSGTADAPRLATKVRAAGRRPGRRATGWRPRHRSYRSRLDGPRWRRVRGGPMENSARGSAAGSDSSTTGTSAWAYMSRKGIQTPWSRPRAT